MRSIHLIVLSAAVAGGIAVLGVPGPAAAEDEWQGLPPGQGREETFYLCGACHSLKLVVQQGLSRERWDEILKWMVDEQEMDPPEPAERALILDYLALFYGPDRRAKRR